MSAERIRALNDHFRTTFVGGQVVVTVGVQALASDIRAMAIRRVATFSEFGDHDDPYGEHDFGAFELAGHKLFWKIDSYDADPKYGLVNTFGPAQPSRVLTIMLAEEY